MAEALDNSALARWQWQPISFIEEVLRDPETSKPFALLDAERQFLAHAYRTDHNGRLVHPEQLYACPKKSGKSGFAAMHLLTTTLIFGGRFAEGYAIANDLEQAQGRVFQAARRICEASPHLWREAHIPRLIEGSGKFLAFRCWLDSDGGMIRGGFLGEEDRNKLIALGRRPVG